MELKYDCAIPDYCLRIALIVPEWNWNDAVAYRAFVVSLALIVPEWNWNWFLFQQTLASHHHALIVPEWNWNTWGTSALITILTALIVPEWNWNIDREHHVMILVLALIVPEWNWNWFLFQQTLASHHRFNRTRMELK